MPIIQHILSAPPIYPDDDTLEAMARTTVTNLAQETYLMAFIAYQKYGTLGELPRGVQHPYPTILQDYAAEDITVCEGSACSYKDLYSTIARGNNAPACMTDTEVIIYRDMGQKLRDGFSILIPTEKTALVFGENLNLSCITVSHQEHSQPRLNINLSAEPEIGMPSVRKKYGQGGL